MTCRNYPPETKTIKFDLLKQKTKKRSRTKTIEFEAGNYPTGYKWFTKGSGVDFIKKNCPNWRGKVIHTNKSCKFFYPEKLSKENLIQRLM